MAEENNPDKEMEMLSKAIVDAIIRSRDVKKAITKLSGTEDVCSKSFMVLMLKLEHLAEAMGLDFSGACGSGAVEADERKEAAQAPKKRKPSFTNIEDGRKLTKAEIAFRDYLASRFDQDKWLKNNGLIF